MSLLFLLSFSLKDKSTVLAPNITSYCVNGSTNSVSFEWEYGAPNNGCFGVFVGNETLVVPVYDNSNYCGNSITVTNSSLILPNHTITFNVVKDNNTSSDIVVIVPDSDLPYCCCY